MRRIGIFCEKWETGGIEAFLSNLLLRMDLSALQVDLITTKLCPSIFTAPLEAAGIRFIELSGSQQRFWQNWRMFWDLLRREHYDLVHLNLFQGMSLHYARLAAKEGVPVRIAHSHNADLRKSLLRPVKLLLSRCYSLLDARWATELWACSKPAAEFLFPASELKKRGYTFIPNGIDLARFTFRPEAREEVRARLGLTDKFVLGHVGRLCYQKNQSFLLDLLAALGRPDAVLLLVGEGEDRAMLEAKAAALGLTDQVIFYGTSDRVEELYQAMDVFVFPSLFEGLPVTLVEAQAAGLPCLVSDRVTGECQVTDGLAFLPLDAPGRWVEALRTNRSGLDRAAGADQVRSHGFDAAEIAAQIERQYREAV